MARCRQGDPGVSNRDDSAGSAAAQKRGLVVRFLDLVEWLGNKLPDPAVLFLVGMLAVWGLSYLLSGITFTTQLEGFDASRLQVQNLLTPDRLAGFLAGMVKQFVAFPPLGVVLVALLGVGIAERSGYINALLKSMLIVTPRQLLTPMLILVAVISHTAADSGYVLVIPIGGVMFHAAGRHPLAGIAAAFAGVSGGFAANFIPSGIDPLLAGLTESGARVLDAEQQVNPLCNIFFTGASSVVIVLLGWLITDRVVEPKLQSTEVDADPKSLPQMAELTRRDLVAMLIASAATLVCVVGLVLWAIPADSALRAADGSLTSMRPAAPLMDSIVPLIFFLFAIPGLIFGYLSGSFKNHRDVIKGMSGAMETMGYYMVLVFFAALFIYSFNESNLGTLVAVTGAGYLQGLPAVATVVGIVLLSAAVNLVVGSASAKWALLAPIFVPMLMALGISPDLTQAAYRVGDSTTNIITPMMPYFPLVVVFCQRYVSKVGIGTVTSMMLPYSIVFLICWTIFLVIYWQLGIPLGLQASYDYVPAQ